MQCRPHTDIVTVGIYAYVVCHTETIGEYVGKHSAGAVDTGNAMYDIIRTHLVKPLAFVYIGVGYIGSGNECEGSNGYSVILDNLAVSFCNVVKNLFF